MTHAATTPRAQQLLDRLEAWAHRGRVRSLLVKVTVTVAGPLVILAGIAMTVLPGPGLVVVGKDNDLPTSQHTRVLSPPLPCTVWGTEDV